MPLCKALGELLGEGRGVEGSLLVVGVTPSNLRKPSFAPLLEMAGLPTIRFHDLRHTCATLLLSWDVNPRIVSEMLGHATVAITIDTYSLMLPNMQEGAARALKNPCVHDSTHGDVAGRGDAFLYYCMCRIEGTC